ncbi:MULTISPECIES: zinc ribbon domain-containing protein [unclassified Fusobacterium]|uniref:zinc ribbon domain-containing protein n=1 Tax=unclassified Fusobacterium TaxID=2648384 RepID=UPI0025C1B9F1|nr:zinc ribbon domain-containing protein [Fusobacterium sp.]
MKLDFRCMKCGSERYQVKTTVIPEKNPGLKLEIGTYYLKTCLDCGYTEIYSAKIVNLEKDDKKKVCPEY